MTRTAFFAVLAAGLASAARADVPVAPPPREIRPDGTRDPAPAPEAAKRENPLEIVERIIANSKAVGDKLAEPDTGPDTRKTQDAILRDIDRLLNQDPPPKDDKNQDKDKNKDNKPDDKKSDMPMGGGMNDPMPKDGMGGGMDQQPSAGMGGGDQPRERRPRQGDRQQPMGGKQEPGKNPGGGGKQQNKDPMGGKPMDPKSPGGGKTPDPKDGKTPPSRPLLPFEDDVARDVWGHLPDKLRQQATQYYKQEIMPRYAELLKQYYSSMSDKR
jgi:hypothetical protein